MSEVLPYSKEWLLRRIKKAGGIHFPSSLQIELTSYCNAVCFFCAHTGSDRPQQHMSQELFMDIIDQVRDLPQKLDLIYLTGLGEPLMHPHWRDLYAYCRGLPCAFTTNCSLLTDKDIDFILDLDFYEVAFSLDTMDPKRHQSIRGFSVDRVAPKIAKAFELGAKKNTDTRLIVSTTVTYDTLDDMIPMYTWLVPKLEMVKNSFWHIKQIGRFPDVKAPIQIMPSMDYVKKLNPKLPPHPKVQIIQDEDELRPHCTLWFDRVTVLSDGNCVPCCHQAKAYQNLGNLNHHHLLDIFNNPTWTETQEKFANKDYDQIPYCKDCR